MGVSGSGKTTVAQALAHRLGWRFAEGDAFHSDANVRKMRSGQALDDDDRRPWLDAIGAWITQTQAQGESAVLTCSALKRAYRDRLRGGSDAVWFAHLAADPDVLLDRVVRRSGHYMPPSLLDSQLQTLEPLQGDEAGVTLDADGSRDDVVAQLLDALRAAHRVARVMTPLLLAADPITSAGHTQLGLAAALGIATVVLLITTLKVHPFLALILGSAVLGSVAGAAPAKTVASFTAGVGSTVGSVGLLIALGAMIGGLLGDSGGAQRIVGSVVDRFSGNALPWAMAGVAALVGLPLFFEIGVVLLVPIVLLVSTRTDVPLVKIGIPALAGLSVLHGLVPPHPGPLAAIAALKADLGLTLLFGIIIAIPTVVIAGPVYGSFISRYVHAHPPRALVPDREPATVGSRSGSSAPGPAGSTGSGDLGEPTQASQASAAAQADEPVRPRRSPSFAAAAGTVLLPVVLMLAGAIGELTLDDDAGPRKVLDVAGTPVVALLAGVVLAMFTLGRGSGMDREAVSSSLSSSLPPIAGILLIVAAGGGFKQTLVDSGVGQLVADAANGASLSPLLLGWLVAVGIRLATGSATVATITAASIVVPLADGLDRPTLALLALAVGAGSLFFSHVNDAGFWLVKEYFGMTVKETILTWSVMETIISVCGLLGVLLLSVIV